MAPKSAPIRLTLVLSGLVLCHAGPAAAYEAEVTAHSDFQLYSVRSPFGSPELRRQRYTQTLGLGVYDLQGAPDPRRARWSFSSRLRFQVDFGQQDAERDPSAAGRYVPGLVQAPVDFMAAYLEGRNLAGGLLGVRLGRQYVVDSLGWWSFDGLAVTVTTPAFVALETYGGFEQRGGLPLLSTSRFAADGVYRGSRHGLETGQWPSYLEESKLAPAYGVGLKSAGLHWLRARADYRRVTNRDRVVVSQYGVGAGAWELVSGNRVSSERAGGSVEVFDPDVGSVSLGAVYDLYAQAWAQGRAGVDWYATPRWVLGAGYDYYLPTFDGDSIFNWFSHHGMSQASLNSSWTLSRQLDLATTTGVRSFTTSGDPESGASSVGWMGTTDRSVERTVADFTGSVVGTYRWAEGLVGTRAIGETGPGGHLVGGDVTTRHLFAGGYYDTLVILSLYDWSDDLRPTRDATSFTYVLGGGVHPGGTRIGVEWEHTTSRLVGQRFRIIVTLDLMVFR